MNRKHSRLVALILLLALAPLSVDAQVASITVRWTAPGDDGYIGTAASYDIRWANAPPDTSNATAFATWFTSATPVPNPPAPLLAGTVQAVVVSPVGGFPLGRTYYFVIRTRDDAGNLSPLSNVAMKVIPLPPDTAPPGRVFDFRCD